MTVRTDTMIRFLDSIECEPGRVEPWMLKANLLEIRESLRNTAIAENLLDSYSDWFSELATAVGYGGKESDVLAEIVSERLRHAFSADAVLGEVGDGMTALVKCEQCGTLYSEGMHGAAHCIHALRAKLDAANHNLAECYRLSGGDPDGDEDWRLASRAVAEVKRLREECDSMERQLAEPSEVRVELARLSETLADVAGKVCRNMCYTPKGHDTRQHHLMCESIRERIERHENETTKHSEEK